MKIKIFITKRSWEMEIRKHALRKLYLGQMDLNRNR